MSRADDEVHRVLTGEGPWFEAMLDARARELAPPPEDDRPGVEVAVLTLGGETGRWALPLTSVARVEPLPRYLPVPGAPRAVLGLALLAGRRCLLADLETLVAGAPPRLQTRAGYAVMLRGQPVAVAVDRAEAVVNLAAPPSGTEGLRAALMPDGTILLNPERLVAELLGRRS